VEKETQPTIVVDTAVSADGVSIAYEVRGEGEPALVFIHGWAGMRGYWNTQLSYFSNKYKVVSIDLASFGESGNNREHWTMSAFGDDVVSVVNHLGLNEVILIGHSMGTAVILETAIKIPEKIIGLVPEDMLQNIKNLKSSEEQIDKSVISLMNTKNNPTQAWKESLKAALLWLSNDLIRVLEEIKTPICCINSDRIEHDIDLTRKYAHSFNVKIVEGVGHEIHREAPDEFNRLLEETIQEFVQKKTLK
jgi:pimeloyl-ACP methyl ester carboxylesterase